MITDIFTSRTDLPTQAQDPDFWRLVSDKNTKKCFVLLILNDLRKYDPIRDEPLQVLSKIKAFQEAIDMMATLSDDADQSLPSDDPFAKGKKPEEEA